MPRRKWADLRNDMRLLLPGGEHVDDDTDGRLLRGGRGLVVGCGACCRVGRLCCRGCEARGVVTVDEGALKPGAYPTEISDLREHGGGGVRGARSVGGSTDGDDSGNSTDGRGDATET